MQHFSRSVMRRVFGSVTRPVSSAAKTEYDVLIVGGGSAGLGLLNNWACHPTASEKLSDGKKFSFGVIEPSEKHYYQPLWTLIGGRVEKKAGASERLTGEFIPKDADWIQDAVTSFDPANNQVKLSSGEKVKYRTLIVTVGLQINYNQIKGLKEALEDPSSSVCTNYGYDYCQKTARCVEAFEGGNAYFTFPAGPVKCAGAPQKIMYLAHSTWEKKALPSNIHFNTAIDKMFAVTKYRLSLDRLCDEKRINRNFGHELVEIDGSSGKAVFKINPTINPGAKEKVTVEYDFIHVTPPMGAPDFLKESDLVDDTGFVTVDKETLQHTKYPNIFSLGDCSNVPTSKTLSAVAAQLPVARYRAGKLLESKETEYGTPDDFNKFILGDGPIYDGYSSCPLPVGDDKGIIAEFNYELQPQETMFWDQSLPGKANYFIKSTVLAPLYWNLYLSGKWEGPWQQRKFWNPKNK